MSQADNATGGLLDRGDASRSGEIVVKFVAKGMQAKHQDVFLRQFPGGSGIWGRCRFVFDPDARDYDWLAVYDDLPPYPDERFSSRVETLACPRRHTLFITMEPSSIKTYGYDFLDQFGVIITSQEPWAITNPQAVRTQPALRWLYGVGSQRLRTWDEMAASPPERKTVDLSAVSSSKKQRNTVHAARYEFTIRLKRSIPEMALYGRGIRPIDDKADALDGFRYHLVIENHIAPHHWTEKLADAYLGLTLPFYYGCPNAAEYFPAESFIAIDIREPDAAVRRIAEAIAAGEFERRLPAIREARRRVLEKYNLFAVIAGLVEQRFDATAAREPGALVYSRHRSRSRSPLHALRFALEHIRTRRHYRSLKPRTASR
ncbi:MAG TPA: glycosyltransferase [Alphaproteobacteria bacterium]|nr:glycosyltransferase [Alphaproteobacteria bacterium]